MQPHLRQQEASNESESGFVLVLALVVLLILSLFGIWASNTSRMELDVAGGLQRYERQFNVAEGGAYIEALNVGQDGRPFYVKTNLAAQENNPLLPSSDAEFDPGNDTINLWTGVAENDHETWPWDNLLGNYDNLPTNTDQFDYRYLVVYLGEDDKPHPGEDLNKVIFYDHRIQGNAARTRAIVELAGVTRGPRYNN